MAAGRPTDYTPELAAKFCGYVATHSMSMKKLCAKYNELPHSTTISEWLAKWPAFRSLYLEAKEMQALIITDELWDKVESVPAVTEELGKFDREFRFHQWHLSKLAPKQFGDKKEVKSEMNINVHEQDLAHLK